MFLLSKQGSVVMNHDCLHPHPADGIKFTFTVLHMEFVGGQEFWSREEPGCLRSGICEHCNVDSEDYDASVFKSG